MDIERLKELREELDELLRCPMSVWNGSKYEDTNELTDAGKYVLALIDESIARQSVTSDEVAEAIEQLKYAREQDREFDDGTFVDSLDLAITALQAYQPWIPFSERLPTEEDADGNANVMCLFADNAIETWVWNEITEWNLDDARKERGFVGITHWRPMLPEPPKGE